MWRVDGVLRTIIHQTAKFGGAMSYGKEDVIFSILIPVPVSIPILMFSNGQMKKSFYAVNKIIPSSLFSAFLFFSQKRSTNMGNVIINMDQVSCRSSFSSNHVLVSPTPFVKQYKIKTRLQFSSLYFIDYIFNDYFGWIKVLQFICCIKIFSWLNENSLFNEWSWFIQSIKIFYSLNQNCLFINLFVGKKQCIRWVKIIYKTKIIRLIWNI